MPDFGIFRGFNDKLFGNKLYAGQLPTQLGTIGSINIGLLLDNYPNAAAAYSLRLLRTAYTGYAIRVRRSSDNTEQDIGFNGLGALDTTALTTFCGAGNGFVTTWYDQSGNGRNATQTTAANQPQIVSSGSVITQGGKTTIKFINSNLTYFRNTNSWTYQSAFIVNKYDSLVGWLLNQTSFARLIGFYSPDGIRLYNGAFFETNHVPSTTNSALFYANFKGSSSEFATNNNTSSTGNAGTISGSELWIGIANNITSGTALNGNLQEIILYNSDQSSNRTGISTNINTYYGIY